ncbi:MAG: hypothetical protein M1818_006859 [Claussenomyces sp. TS43310]|nr:MAG: hypothetical protein M1818_006859 [Claussenomyces sp. TS43310]
MATMTTKQAIKLPVVDISSVDQESVAAELIDAAATQGFVYIKNLGRDIPSSVVDHAFDLSRKFFSSPIEEKETCKITEDVSLYGTNVEKQVEADASHLQNRGWSGMHTETLDAKNQRVGDFKEAFNIAEFLNGHPQQPLPPSLAPHEAEISTFFTYCHELCLRVLTLFAMGLKIPSSAGGSTFFSTRHEAARGPSGSTLRLLHYPSIPETADYQPDVDIRAGAHSDYGSVTLLFQRPGQPGLEIRTPAGTWAPVAVIPEGTESDAGPPILVNIGDLFSYWTNGLLKSTVHRVIFPNEGRVGGEDRYSMAFFCHPLNDTLLEPVPSAMIKARVVSDRHGEEEKVLTAQEHLLGRLRATYLSLNFDKPDEEI